MPDIGPVPTNYISDGEIIAWLEQKQTEQYGELDSMMFSSNSRTDLIQSLTQLKQDIDAGGKSPQDLLDEMESIRTKYGDTDLKGDLDALLLPMEAKLAPLISTDPNSPVISQTQAAINASNLPPGVKDELNLVNQLANTQSSTGQNDTTVQSLLLAGYTGGWDTNLQGEVDKLGHVDQLDLIKINELVSDSRQTLELGSNLISGRAQTSDTLVANIGRV